MQEIFVIFFFSSSFLSNRNFYSNHRIIFNKIYELDNQSRVSENVYLERELQYSHELSNISSL